MPSIERIDGSVYVRIGINDTVPAMTFTEFRVLSVPEQLALIDNKGVLLGQLEFSIGRVKLYQLDDLFAEVFEYPERADSQSAVWQPRIIGCFPNTPEYQSHVTLYF